MNNDYLNYNNINVLFQLLQDSILLNRPDNVIEHIKASLRRIKDVGLDKFKEEIFESKDANPLTNICCKGLFRFAMSKVAETSEPFEDFRVLLLITPPGEAKPYSDELERIYANCGYINVGQCLKKRLIIEKEKAISQWVAGSSLHSSGEFMQKEIALQVVLDEMKAMQSKELIIIEGYPKDMKQVTDFDNAIGMDKLLKVIAVDSYESKCVEILDENSSDMNHQELTPQSSRRRLANYKAHTLPVLKYFQDMGKLILMNDVTNEMKFMAYVTQEMNKEMPHILKKVRNPPTPLNKLHEKILEVRTKIEEKEVKFDYTKESSTYHSEYTFHVEDIAERKFRLASTPLILVVGAPKVGKSTIIKKVCKIMPDWFHFDLKDFLQSENLTNSKCTLKRKCCIIRSQLDMLSNFAAGIILENFPTTYVELTAFFKEIGVMDLQIFIDASRYTILHRWLNFKHDHINSNNKDDEEPDYPGEAEDCLEQFYRETIPVISHVCEKDISFDCNGNQTSDEIAAQIINILLALFY